MAKCGTCNGSGNCVPCAGTGHWLTKPEITCTACNGSGNCSSCSGSGEK